MTGHPWEIALIVIGAVMTAVVGGIVSTIFRRAEKTGERLGRVEKWVDVETGRRLGVAEEQKRRKINGE